MEGESEHRARILRPYVPRLEVEWLADEPARTFREIEGTLVFVDISGFTKLSERLSRRGKVGAEELTDTIGGSFQELLAVAYENGGGLIKFGGDALLLLFRDEDHATRACRAAVGMRATLRRIGSIITPSGRVGLRMSVGVHTGAFHFFLVGEEHRELLITGPAATQTTIMEQTAEAGEILVSKTTAAAIAGRWLGGEKGDGVLLRSMPVERTNEIPVEQYPAGVDPTPSIPHAIREHLLGGGSEPEHRQATVAFVRFEGSDAVISSEGPEAMAERLNALIVACQTATAAHQVSFLGSDIDRDGGKIILAAGAPRTTGADEEAMLLAVRAIVESSPPLPIRIGVNRGHVFAGDIGPSYRRTYTVMGDTVNLAARLMAAAGAGQILAANEVLERSRSRFTTHPLESFTVKGKTQPVQASVVGSVEGSSTTATDEASPFIGRKRELGLLLDALDEARARRGRVFEIIGEPGMGASRLVEEVRSRAEGVSVHTTNGGPYAAATPYFPFRTLLRDMLGIRGTDDQVLSARRLRDRVAANTPDALPWLPLLGVVLDVSVDPTPETRALDEAFRRAQLERVTVDFLGAAQPTAALFVFEDVHFFDESSADLLRALIKASADQPWLIVLTRRAGRGSRFITDQPHARTLGLAPLDPDTASALIVASTEDDPPSEHELAALVERSGGNPMFLRELLNAWRAAGTIENLPDSVETMMAARIDRLPPADRNVLRAAAVLGTAFDGAWLPAVLEGEVPGDDDAIWRRLSEFMRRDARGWYRFSNVLIRDAAYEGLTYRRREALHAAVGETILQSDAAIDQVELLALHFFHAQRWDETWRFARLAGMRADEKYANVEAARFYEQALEAAKRLGVIPEQELAAVLEMLGDVRRRAGDFREADTAFRGARRLASTDAIADVRLLIKESLVAERLGRYPEALRRLARGRRLLEDAPGERAAALRADLLAAYAAVRQIQGHYADAIRWCRRAIAEAETAGNRAALAKAYRVFDWAFVSLGRAEDTECSQKALDIYEDLGDVTGQALVLNNLGAYAYFEGRWNDAVTLYERSRLARERIGDPVNAAVGTLNIGEILSDQGRLEEAEPLLRHALRVWRSAGDRSGVAFAESFLGRLAARAGRFTEALELYERARAEFVNVVDVGSVVETDARIAECHVLRGDGLPALELIDQVLIEGDARAGTSAHVPMLRRLRGYALLQLGDPAAARVDLEESLRAARQRKADYEAALTLRALARLAALEGTPDEASQQESEEILSRLGVVAVTDPEGLPAPAEPDPDLAIRA